MTILAKFALFWTSYVPLLVILWLQESLGRGWWSLSCLLSAIAGTAILVVVMTASKRRAKSPIVATEVRVRDGEILAYVATNLLPFVTGTIATQSGRLSMLVFFLLIAVLYVTADLFYINPLLALFGYRIFEITTPKENTAVLVTRKRFVKAGQRISAIRLSDYVYWEN